MNGSGAPGHLRFICRQLRFSDARFQYCFVATFLVCTHGAVYVWPDYSSGEHLWLLHLITIALAILVFSNTEVWLDTKSKDIVVRHTFLRIVPWRAKVIERDRVIALEANRVSEKDAWPKLTGVLVWLEWNDGMMMQRTITVLQRRQELGVAVRESRQIAKQMGIAFRDRTKTRPAVHRAIANFRKCLLGKLPLE